jgi:NADPH:quinone reductase-like Zn-dependent oxidoreductase
MEQILIRRPGGYGRLEIVSGPDPEPGPGEILIDTAAIGVNYADCIARMGLYASARELAGYPLVPGFELAGTVRALGDGVGGPAPGTRVLGVTLFGAYATRVCLPAARVFPIPEGVSFAAAAAFPTVFLTAWYALERLARAEPGEHVLVHSAAGGVGGALLQLARAAGCRVTGVVGAGHKIETARRLGADAVIDRSRGRMWSEAAAVAPSGVDVVCDATGGATLRGSYRHLASGGRLVVYGFHSLLPRRGGRPSWPRLVAGWLRTPRFDPLRLTRDNRSVLGFNLSFLSERETLLGEALRDLLGRLAEGALVAPPIEELEFRAVADAHRALESGDTVGKLVLTCAGADHRTASA